MLADTLSGQRLDSPGRTSTYLTSWAEEGEEVTIKLPAGARQYKVVELSTLPQQMEAGGS